MSQRLSDVRSSIDRFVYEAEKCAKKEYGFAALLTIFPVILAVSEAIKPGRDNKDLVRNLLAQMDDKTSWVILPRSASKLSDYDLAKKLTEIRDSLAHQLSLPSDVVLANNRSEARGIAEEHPQMYILSTIEFISAVRQTVQELIEAHPSAILDSHPRVEPRGAADRLEFQDTSASSMSANHSTIPKETD